MQLRRGTYDVIRNEWVVPPADARYVNSEASPFGRRAETLRSSGGVAPVRRVSAVLAVIH